MATVVGIFENHFKNKKPLPVVRPGSQSRKFTHVKDTIKACIISWKRNKNQHYSIASSKSYSIIQLAKLFKTKIKYLPSREGERSSSILTRINLSNKIIKLNAKIKLVDYISSFLKKKPNSSLQI
jgi:UDP-glucose 4-epimerase